MTREESKKNCDGCKWLGWIPDDSSQPWCLCDICENCDQWERETETEDMPDNMIGDEEYKYCPYCGQRL